jgi:hypothetical protein
MAMTQKQLAMAEQARKDDPAIGRRKLVALTGCTHFAAARFLKGDCGVRTSKGHKEISSAAEEVSLSGITLSPATRICDRRPPVTVRAKFYSLQKGKAFKLSDLSRQWGFSVETIKRHARDEGCFAYVDTTGHDDFEECAMHPETAMARLKGN